MASGGTNLRAEANKARDEAREHGSKGTEAAKESAAQYKGAVQQEGLSALKGAEDRYETAKDYTMEKSGQAVDTASAAANDATDTVVDAKNSVAVGFSSPLSFSTLCLTLPEILEFLHLSNSLLPKVEEVMFVRM